MPVPVPPEESDFSKLFVPEQQPVPPVLRETQMYFISTYPPLGGISQVPAGEVVFYLQLQVHQSLAKEPWEVALWHSSGDGASGGEWAETTLSTSRKHQVPSNLQTMDQAVVTLHFTGNLPIHSTVHFTVKFRQSGIRPWRWVRDELKIGDGLLLVEGESASKSISTDLPSLISGFNPVLRWRSEPSQCPDTLLWSIDAPVEAVKEDASALADITLGLPWGGFSRWFSLVRPWSPWLAPRQGKEKFGLDKDAVLAAFLSPAGKHMVLLGISGLGDVMTLFRSNEDGQVVIHLRSDSVSSSTGTVLVAVADKFESAMAAVMYHARTLVHANKKSTGEYDAELSALRDDVKPEWYENWYDGLGYCTWNALGQRLTEEKVLEAVDTLADNKIRITSLIIDDNWQDIDYRGEGQFQQGWNDFEAEPRTFPHGLKDTITKIRCKHKNIEHVAVWHALLGYWAGISPDGPLAKRYKTVKVVREDDERRNLPLGGKMTVIAKDDVQKFYDDFYSFLASCGIDGVKTDAQFMMDTWTSATARRELMHTYLDAWTIASLRHFSIKAISCMSQVPQIIFYAQLPQNRPAVLVRNSDDFFPQDPAAHPWHVWTNAHNSLLTQHLNILPDWDMFQTVHDYSGFHAAARCVSGGPIYITDVPGQHNLDLIKQMTGVTTRGKTVVFRPSVLGRTIDQYVGYDDGSLLKVAAYHGRAATGSSIMGVFNIAARPLTDIIPLSRFSGVLASQHYIVRCHSTGSVTDPVQTGVPTSLLTVSLGVRGYDIFTAYPLSIFESGFKGRVYLATLGLLGKMTGSAAILNNKIEWLQNGRVLIETNLKALGALGVYISILPELDLMEDFVVTIQGQTIPPHTGNICKTDERVLEIDVEKAWDEMGLDSGWSNELVVKTYFTLNR